MFPIRDHNPSGRTPYVVYTLLALNIGVYLLQVGFVTTDQQMIQHLYSWSMIPARITSGDGYYTLVTSMFLHGGFWHRPGGRPPMRWTRWFLWKTRNSMRS